jgi:hypothetical protein
MIQKVPHAQTMFRVHNGSASASTFDRNLGGSEVGVNKSTGTPMAVSSASSSPARSNRLVRGGASTSMSKSLPSISSPCSADPNRRGFVMPDSRTIRRMASRCWEKTSDGFISLILAQGSRPAALNSRRLSATSGIGSDKNVTTMAAEVPAR